MKHDPKALSRINAQLVLGPSRLTKAFARHELQTAFRTGEAERIAEVKAAGRVPDACGNAIPDAPARGPVQVFEPREVARTSAGGFRTIRTGDRGRSGLRRADAFDVAQAQADRSARGRGKPAVPLFTAAQIEAGRTYATLAERLAASGITCISIEGQSGGTGADRGVSEATCDLRNRFNRMQEAIGMGFAISPRRNMDRGQRQGIRSLRLMHLFCVSGQSIDDILRCHNWAPNGRNRKALREALKDALNAIYGL